MRASSNLALSYYTNAPASVQLTASGGVAPYTYVAHSALPPGLSLQGSQITGSPTTPGRYPVRVLAYDSVDTPKIIDLAFNVKALSAPVLLEGFNSLSGFSVTGGTQSLDTTRKVQGAGMVAVQGNGTASNNPFIVKTTDTTQQTYTGTVAMYIRHYAESERQPFQIAPKLGRSGTYYDVFTNRPGFGNARPSGGFWVAVHSSESNASLRALPPGQFDRQLNVSQNTLAGYNAWSSKVGWDALMLNCAGRPTILFAFDDAENTAATVAAPYMTPYGIPGTLYLPSAEVGLNNTKLSVSQVSDLYAAGWDVACNTTDDSALTEFSTVAGAVADLSANRDYLTSHGWTRARDHFCYPGPHTGSSVTSATDISPAPVALPAVSASSGSTSITFATAASTSLSGYDIQAVGIPAYTTMTVAGDGLTATLSAPTTAAISARAAIAVDRRGEFYMGKLQTALSGAGFLTGRLAYPLLSNQDTMYTRYGFGDAALWLSATFLSGATTWTSIKAKIDEAVLRGTTLIIGVHRISATDPGSGSIQVYETLFKQIVDYVGALKAADTVECLTISQLWNRDNGGQSRLP